MELISIKDKLNIFRKNKMMCEVRMDVVNDIIANSGLELFEQPIVYLQNEETYAREYLNRPLKTSGFKHPGELYSFAASHGQIEKVDTMAINNVFSSGIGRDDIHFVNMHLSTLFSDQWKKDVKGKLDSFENIVLEISEREGLASYTRKQVSEKIAELKQAGFSFAIDDIGIGYSGLTNLTLIKPDYVKIDRMLVDYIDEDEYRQHLMKALIKYWLENDVKIVAEGIERIEEAEFFKELGVHFGQGYLSAKANRVTRKK